MSLSKTTVQDLVLKADLGVNIPLKMELLYEDSRHKMLVTIPDRGSVLSVKNRTRK